MELCAKFLIIVVLCVIVQGSSNPLENCSETKRENLNLKIEISKLKLEIALLESKNYNLSARIGELTAVQVNNVSTNFNSTVNESKKSIEEPKMPKNCQEAAKGQVGVFKVEIPHSNLEPFPVYCDSDNWMVILRRVDASVDFQRDWSNYRDGFGDITGNFIMGLEKMHQVTKSQCHELKVVLEDFENNTTYAFYDKYKISNENHGYSLKTLGHYSGTAGDALDYHKGLKFSTIDRDNDFRLSGNCAGDLKGGWWFNNCSHSKLTGIYLMGGVSDSKGIEWYDSRRGYYSYKYAEMKIRPTTC